MRVSFSLTDGLSAIVFSYPLEKVVVAKREMEKKMWSPRQRTPHPGAGGEGFLRY